MKRRGVLCWTACSSTLSNTSSLMMPFGRICTLVPTGHMRQWKLQVLVSSTSMMRGKSPRFRSLSAGAMVLMAR
jgi:hypothetical protein